VRSTLATVELSFIYLFILFYLFIYLFIYFCFLLLGFTNNEFCCFSAFTNAVRFSSKRNRFDSIHACESMFGLDLIRFEDKRLVIMSFKL